MPPSAHHCVCLSLLPHVSSQRPNTELSPEPFYPHESHWSQAVARNPPSSSFSLSAAPGGSGCGLSGLRVTQVVPVRWALEVGWAPRVCSPVLFHSPERPRAWGSRCHLYSVKSRISPVVSCDSLGRRFAQTSTLSRFLERPPTPTPQQGRGMRGRLSGQCRAHPGLKPQSWRGWLPPKPRSLPCLL